MCFPYVRGRDHVLDPPPPPSINTEFGVVWTDVVIVVTTAPCDNILSGYLCAVTTVFSQQDGIYGFKFPKRFLEISSQEISLFSQLLIEEDFTVWRDSERCSSVLLGIYLGESLGESF